MNNIKKVNSSFEIVSIDDRELFAVNKSNEKIKFYDEELLCKYIETDFNNKYRKLLYLIMEYNEDDDNDDLDLILEKINILKELLLNKYHKFIKNSDLGKYLKMLMLLEEKINTSKRHKCR